MQETTENPVKQYEDGEWTVYEVDGGMKQFVRSVDGWEYSIYSDPSDGNPITCEKSRQGGTKVVWVKTVNSIEEGKRLCEFDAENSDRSWDMQETPNNRLKLAGMLAGMLDVVTGIGGLPFGEGSFKRPRPTTRCSHCGSRCGGMKCQSCHRTTTLDQSLRSE